MAVRYRLFSFYDELGLSRTAHHFLNAAYTSFAPLNDPPTEADKLPFGLYWLFFKSSS
jgi:hypothetical protein